MVQFPAMRWLKIVKKDLDWTTYKLAKSIGVTHHCVWNMEHKSQGVMSLKNLCRIRAVSGISWLKLGALLDRDYLGEYKDYNIAQELKYPSVGKNPSGKTD